MGKAKTKPRPSRAEALKGKHALDLLTTAVKILDQHRARVRSRKVHLGASNAARRAVQMLDALLWHRPVKLDEAVRLFADYQKEHDR